MTDHDVTNRIVDVGRARLSVTDYGGPSSMAALVVPGAVSPARTWQSVANVLRSSMRPYVVDLPAGHPPADLLGVIEALGLDRPVLIGHSLGARVVAAAGVSDPEVASALVLLDPPLTGPEGFVPLWHRLRGPIALIHGADSPEITPSAAEALAEANDSAALISVPDTRHIVPWENPTGLVAVLERVVQMLTAPVERKA